MLVAAVPPLAGTLVCLGALALAAVAPDLVPSRARTRVPPLANAPAATPLAPSPLALESVDTAAAELPRLHALIVSSHGQIVLERYFRGAGPNKLANVKSVSKSVISALVGIALERKLLSGVDQPIGSFFPRELRGEDAERKKAITIEDLLTMRSGLESTSSRNYGAWVRSPNWVRYVLARPLVSEPGTSMDYSTGSSHLLSAILTKASGKSTWQFAQEALARPLGFSLARWTQDLRASSSAATRCC